MDSIQQSYIVRIEKIVEDYTYHLRFSERESALKCAVLLITIVNDAQKTHAIHPLALIDNYNHPTFFLAYFSAKMLLSMNQKVL